MRLRTESGDYDRSNRQVPGVSPLQLQFGARLFLGPATPPIPPPFPTRSRPCAAASACGGWSGSATGGCSPTPASRIRAHIRAWAGSPLCAPTLFAGWSSRRHCSPASSTPPTWPPSAPPSSRANCWRCATLRCWPFVASTAAKDLLRRTEQEFQREIARRTRKLLTATETGV